MTDHNVLHALAASWMSHRPMRSIHLGRLLIAVGLAAATATGMAQAAHARFDAPLPGRASRVTDSVPSTGIQQVSSWQGIVIDGATCGGPPAQGSDARPPYKYFLNPATEPGAGILFVLNGGGACMKDGPPPPGATGSAAQLHCMSFSNFRDVGFSDAAFATDALPARLVPYFDRTADDNPFRDWTYVALPYCTGDVHAGRMTGAYDYDPDDGGEFLVLHRGALNVMAVLDDVHLRAPEDVPVVLTGFSAGGFGAIYNFPEVIKRWPRTTLIPDSGIAPAAPGSLLVREGARIAERWRARDVLPPYCVSDACLSDTLSLLAAHAVAYDGNNGRPWRPFGLLQGQQDATLTGYLEISACSYELGLRRSLGNVTTDNVRAYVPATTKHVFGVLNPLTGDRPFVSAGGVDAHDWFRQLAMSTTPDEMPASAIDPWLPCYPTFLPLTGP